MPNRSDKLHFGGVKLPDICQRSISGCLCVEL